MSVANHITNRSQKFSTSQLSLWGIEEQQPEAPHHHVEVVYLSGHRETYCTADSYRPTRPGDWQTEAGFVGGARSAVECQICKRRAAA